jgi:hypothetical protein
LDNHVKDLVSVDFFVMPTVTFRILFVFIVLVHARRRIVHFNDRGQTREHPAVQAVERHDGCSARWVCRRRPIATTSFCSRRAAESSRSCTAPWDFASSRRPTMARLCGLLAQLAGLAPHPRPTSPGELLADFDWHACHR